MTVVIWAAVVYRYPAVWRGTGPPARRALWFALVALALGWTVRIPEVYLLVDRTLRVPNLAQLAGDLLALATGCGILAMLLFQTEEPAIARRRLRVRLAGVAVAAVAMSVAFAAADFDDETVDFWARYAGEPSLLTYSIPYLVYVAYVFADLMRLSWWYAKIGRGRYLSIGMWLIAAASVLGQAYVLLRVVFLIAVAAGAGGRLRAYDAVSIVLVAGVSLLAVVGAVLPALGSNVVAYRSHRRLRPLWSALYRANPAIALAAPSSREALETRDLDFRLHRRVIEIRDGLLALRPRFPPEVADAARELSRREGLRDEQDVEAVALAAMIAVAVRNGNGTRPAPAAADDAVIPGGAGLEDETAWLERVSTALADSPIVQRFAGNPEEAWRGRS